MNIYRIIFITAALLVGSTANAFDFGSILDKVIEKTIDKSTDKVTDSVSGRVSDSVDGKVNSAMDGVTAAPQTGASPDMQSLMQQAQQAQLCMQDIDTSVLEKMEKEGSQIESKVKALCASGQRGKAQKVAIDYSRTMMNSTEVKKLRECGESLRGMMPVMPYDNMEENFKNKHVCDEI
ncbi:MAG TPA: hypothetical protein DD827_04110 [Gammaproteobacteria bacterium]|nr:hypothetical protein [Gammaproteobacteria bacterium]